jgi:hypothetical protein
LARAHFALSGFRAGVRALDGSCTVVALTNTNDAGFSVFADPAAIRIIDVQDFVKAPVEGCAVYYRGTSCYSPDAVVADGSEGSAVCHAFESHTPLTPISEWSLPSAPYRGEHYAQDPMPVGLFRIDGPTAQ